MVKPPSRETAIVRLVNASASRRRGTIVGMSPEVQPLLSRAHQQLESGEFGDAIATCRRALDVQPDHPRVIYALATVLREAGRTDEAIEQYRAALAHEPRNPQLANDLGALLLSRGEIDEAERLLTLAVASGIRSPLPYRNLARLKLHRGDAAAAVTLFRTRLALQPTSRAHHELGVAMVKTGALADAAEHFRLATELEPSFGPAWCNLALSLEEFHRPADAAAAMRRAAELEPDSPAIAYHLAALTGGAPPPICPPGYVTDLFDGYAGRFDDHLVRQLHYRGPELVSAAAAAFGPGEPADVLDLGCGTGLCGEMLRPRARRLVGVDLSTRMLARARQRNVYDELVCDDVVSAMLARPGAADLVTAADLLIYMGDARPLLAAAHEALRPGGLLIFTIELLERGDYRLLPTRRYAHNPHHLRELAAAAGFAEVGMAESVLRAGGSDRDVLGAVVTLRSTPLKN